MCKCEEEGGTGMEGQEKEIKKKIKDENKAFVNKKGQRG